MIDVNTSNNKLIDRAIRLTQEILADYCYAVSYDAIEEYMHQIVARKKQYEEKNIYTPSAVKVAVTMLYRKINFENALSLLYDYAEDLEKICS